jgi:hypothetical protein
MADEFRLIKEYSQIPSGIERVIRIEMSKAKVPSKEVDHIIQQAGEGAYQFHGIFHENNLLGFTFFTPRRILPAVDILFTWTNTSSHQFPLTKGFKKTYGITPADYLLEEMVRDGHAIYISKSTSAHGEQWMGRLADRKLVQPSVDARLTREAPGYRIWRGTENLRDAAHQRKPRLP